MARCELLAGFADPQVRLVYALTSLSIFCMYGMSTLVPLLFASSVCTLSGHSDEDCYRHAGSVTKAVEDTISAEASQYQNAYETGEYMLQLVMLALISPMSDRIGRKKILILGILGISCDAMATAVVARTPTLMVVVHLLASSFTGKYLVMTQVHAIIADRTDADSRSPAFMVLDASIHLGLMTAPLTAGGLAELLRSVVGSYNLGLRLSLVTFGALGIFTALFAACALQESLQASQPEPHELESQLELQSFPQYMYTTQAKPPKYGDGCTQAVASVKSMFGLLTATSLLRRIALIFGMAHFSISGSDSLVELYCSDQFRWEALQWGLFSLTIRVCSITTLIVLFPALKNRFGDGLCLGMATLGRGVGMLFMGGASLGGKCPDCSALIFRQAMVVVGGTELLIGSVLSALLRAIVSRAVDGKRQAAAMSALFILDTFCHMITSFFTKILYAATVHTAPVLPFLIASGPVLCATYAVSRLPFHELQGGQGGQTLIKHDHLLQRRLKEAMEVFGADDPRYIELKRQVLAKRVVDVNDANQPLLAAEGAM